MKNGYATLTIGSRTDGTRLHVLAHRLAYIRSRGVPIDSIAGLVVRHRCDNPRCVNPEHLLIGTHADNTKDMIDRGRHRKVSPTLRLLTVGQVQDIRQAHAAGVSMATNGRRFGVNHKTVGKIVSGRTYKDIE